MVFHDWRQPAENHAANAIRTTPVAMLEVRGRALTGAAVLPRYEQLAVRFPERTDFRLASIDALRGAGQTDLSRSLAADMKRRFPLDADFACRAR